MNHLLETDYEVPTWAAVVIILAVIASLAYGFIVGNIAGPIAIWIELVWLGVALFVVYLFYRFVLAVEKIAENL